MASPKASVVALASAIPLRGKSIGSADARQVMQTNTVVRSAAEFVVTRVAPLAEAPRPAREKKRWQVSWLAGRRALPPSRAVRGTDLSGIGQALAAYSCGGSRGFAPGVARLAAGTTFPLRSLARDHRSRRAVHRRGRGLSMAA